MTARQRAEQQGRQAETRAAWFLRLKGYRILAQRYKCPVGEIDMIARRGKTLVFVEVKRRRDKAAALEAITARQLERITRASQFFLARNKRFADFDQRIDAIVLAGGYLPLHLKNIA